MLDKKEMTNTMILTRRMRDNKHEVEAPTSLIRNFQTPFFRLIIDSLIAPTRSVFLQSTKRKSLQNGTGIFI